MLLWVWAIVLESSILAAVYTHYAYYRAVRYNVVRWKRLPQNKTINKRDIFSFPLSIFDAFRATSSAKVVSDSLFVQDMTAYTATQIRTVWVKKDLPLKFSGSFRKRLGIFSPNFTRLLDVPIDAGLQIFIQLSATLTKLCHIKRDHHNVLKMSTIDRNARWLVALNIA